MRLIPEHPGKVALIVGVLMLPLCGIVLWQSGVISIRGEAVTFRSGDVELHGRIAFPRHGEGPFPAAVIVHGSGRTHWKDLRGYARNLVPQGMAVLMYDKRGVGRSGGSYRTIGILDSEESLGLLASDASAAIDFLAGHPSIDAGKIGFVGGSQAGWIMPLAAASNDRVAYVVAISGPAVTYGEEIHYSRLTGDDPGPYANLSKEEIKRRMAAYDGPFGYDPLPVLGELEVPSLWILGGSDPSVPIDRTVDNLLRLSSTPGSAPIEIELYPEGDHDIRHAVTGKRIDYWPRITNWLEREGITRRP